MNKKWPKCYKCKSTNVELIEIWSAMISWIPSDPHFTEGALEPGDSLKLEGKCLKCRHTWTFRNIVQVKPEWFETQ